METFDNNSCVLLQSVSTKSDILFHESPFQNYYQENLPISINCLNDCVKYFLKINLIKKNKFIII